MEAAKELMRDLEFGLRVFGVIVGKVGGGGDHDPDTAFVLITSYLAKRDVDPTTAAALTAAYIGGLTAGTKGMERVTATATAQMLKDTRELAAEAERLRLQVEETRRMIDQPPKRRRWL